MREVSGLLICMYIYIFNTRSFCFCFFVCVHACACMCARVDNHLLGVGSVKTIFDNSRINTIIIMIIFIITQVCLFMYIIIFE